MTLRKPDTGSLENAMSADEANRPGLKITRRGRQFLMGNGSKVISLRVVLLKCSFALGERCVTRLSSNVFDYLFPLYRSQHSYLQLNIIPHSFVLEPFVKLKKRVGPCFDRLSCNTKNYSASCRPGCCDTLVRIA